MTWEKFQEAIRFAVAWTLYGVIIATLALLFLGVAWVGQQII